MDLAWSFISADMPRLLDFFSTLCSPSGTGTVLLSPIEVIASRGGPPSRHHGTNGTVIRRKPCVVGARWGLDTVFRLGRCLS